MLGFKRILTLKATNKRLKVLCNECDSVVPLLIDVDYSRLTGWTAFPVIKAKHVVSG